MHTQSPSNKQQKQTQKQNNSDVVCEYPLKDMLAAHIATKAEATVLVTKVGQRERKGRGCRLCGGMLCEQLWPTLHPPRAHTKITKTTKTQQQKPKNKRSTTRPSMALSSSTRRRARWSALSRSRRRSWATRSMPASTCSRPRYCCWWWLLCCWLRWGEEGGRVLERCLRVVF